MAASGQVYNQAVTLSEKPDVLMQGLVSATAGTSGYTLNTAGANSVILTRKFTPTWAVVWGIILGLFTLVGFALLLVKTTETLSITLAGIDTGTRVTISGVATPEMIARLNSVLSGASANPEEVTEASAEPLVGEPDTKICPECAETVKAQANVCRFCGHRFDASPAQ